MSDRKHSCARPDRGRVRNILRRFGMRHQARIAVNSGAVLLAVMSVAATALARAPAAPVAVGRSPDQELMRLSTQGNLAEVELGRLAITHSTNPAIENLGTRLAQDGSKGVANLQAVAGMLHVQLPVAPNPAQEGQIAKLSKLHGASFDRQFEQIAREDEGRMLHQFQSGIATASNAAVKSTVKNMIPVVQEHLQIAHGLTTQQASAARAVSAQAERR
jgi:putative membrane protein